MQAQIRKSPSHSWRGVEIVFEDDLGGGGPHDHDASYEPAGATATHAATPHGGEPHDHDADYAPIHGHPYSADDHSHVLTEPDIPAAIARDSEVATAISDHLAAATHGGEASHPDLATHETLGLVTDTDLATHAATAHGTQDHALSGASHTGTLDHSTLSSVTANQHHNQAHAIGGADHTGSLTAADVGAATAGHDHTGTYEPLGTVTTHEAAGNPHPGYLTPAEGDAAYSATGHSHPGGSEAYGVGDLYLTTVDHADSAAVNSHHGYGTWARFGVGRFLLLTDQTAGTEAGSATHGHGFTQPTDHGALSHAGTAVGNHVVTQPANHTEVMNHTHPVTDPGHLHAQQRFPTATGGSTGFTVDTSMSGTPAAANNTASAQTGVSMSNPAGGVASIAHSATAVDAHAVTQPSQHAAQSHSGGAVTDGSTAPLSITAFAWQRTA